jgi:DNA-binding transcriptional ArsR family regulator
MPALDVFAALANPIRRKILLQLRGGPRTVSELARRFDVGRPAVSTHLKILRRARLVRDEPRGRERYYDLNPKPLGEAAAWIHAFQRYWEERIAALEETTSEDEKG